MRKLRTVRYLAWVVATVFAVPYIAGGALAATETASAPQKTMLLFPMDGGKVADSKLAGDLGDLVEAGLAAYAGHRVVVYSQRLPAVQRIERLQPEKSALLEGPFYGSQAAVNNALALGKTMAADIVVVGEVDVITTSGNGVTEIGATVELIDTETGKPVNTVVVTGKSNDPSVATVLKESGAGAAAVTDAAQEIISAITGSEYTKPAPPSEDKSSVRRKKNAWVSVLLLSVAVGLLVGHSGNNN
ncbi:MAG: hypothetical protein ACYC2Y_08500 [Armatimonadota bacterium]